MNQDWKKNNKMKPTDTASVKRPLLKRAMRIQALVLRGIPATVARAMVDGVFRGPYG